MTDMRKPDAADQIVKHILDRIVAADAKRHEVIREEISRRGTWWAATEIDRLRQQVRSLQPAPRVGAA